MFLSPLLARFTKMHQRRRTTVQLGALSDRQLNELDISRQDILEATRRQ